MGPAAAGVLAVKLGREDAVVGMGIARDEVYVAVITENGYAKCTPVRDFPAQRRYGGGVKVARLSARTGQVAAAAIVTEGDDLVLLTARSELAEVPVRMLPVQGRAASGKDRRTDTGEPLIPAGPPILLTVLASPGAPT